MPARAQSKSKNKKLGVKPKTKPGRSNATARDNQRSYIDVLLYVPNLIGYARVLLTGMFFYYAFDAQSWPLAIACYVASFTLDFFDGYFARLLDQCSRLGQVLDMVTDRVSTAVLLAVLSMLQPDRSSIYVFLLALDFSSHWFHMKSAGEGHHKKVDEKRNIILRMYYATYVLFGYCCVSAEFTYITLYTLHYEPQLAIPIIGLPLQSFLWYLLVPGCVIKNIVNVAQLWSAMCTIAEGDAEEHNKK
eukprot:g4153.t1